LLYQVGLARLIQRPILRDAVQANRFISSISLLPRRLASPASSQRHNKSLNTGLAIRSRSLFNTGYSQPVKQTLGIMNITENQFVRAIYSLWDFQQALSALTFLIEDCAFDEKHDKVTLRRFRCYESSLIISMARPFETTRGGTTIGLRSLGIILSKDEKKIKDRILYLRNKITAHSSEEGMHFRVSTLPIDCDMNFPVFQFDEGLFLGEEDILKIQTLLRRIMLEMAKFFFRVAQESPDLLNKYKLPKLDQDYNENA
jgi:hypothetical protein